MCTVYSPACTCYRNQQEHDEECARQARASRIEHEIFAVLRANAYTVPASPLAIRLADLIRSRLDGGARVADILVSDTIGVFFWLLDDGAQHFVRLDSHTAIRLAA